MTVFTSPPTARQAATSPPARHPRHRTVGFVLLTLGVIIASVLAVRYFTEPDDTEAVFDFEQNTLCDWFTADQMESVVAEAMERAGVDVEVESFSTSGSCRMLPGNKESIWDTPGWSSQSDGGLGITLGPVDPRGEGYRSTDPADFERHPVLDDRITYGNRSSGFAYSPGMAAQLLVEGHEDEVLFLGFGVEGDALDQTTMSQQTDFALSIADSMLEQMNWTD